MEREKAQIGVLISMQPPTRPMRQEAASVGLYESPDWNRKYPRLQLLTIEDLLSGRDIDYPQAADTTFKKAATIRPDYSRRQGNLDLQE